MSRLDECITPLVISLAKACYKFRTNSGRIDQERLSVLSDALEEAGFLDSLMLEHLRKGHTTVHQDSDDVCWVIQTILRTAKDKGLDYD